MMNDNVFINNWAKPTKQNSQEHSSGRAGISIYPNPTNGQITINYNCATDGNFYLYNATGQLVSELFLSHQNQRVTTTLQDIANGIYTYKIVFASCPTAQGKITIAK